MKKEAKLTDQQKLAVDIYFANGCNMKQAMMDAGFSETTARNTTGFKNKPAVAKYMKERMEAISSEKIAKQEEIMEALTEVIRRNQNDYAVLPDGTIVQYKVSTADQIKAIEKMMKYYGMDKPDTQQTIKVQTLVYGSDPDNPKEEEDEDYIEV